MSRIKLLVVAAVVAAFALSATAAAASAHEYRSGGAKLAGKTNLKEHEFGGTFVLTGKPFAVAIHIECTKVNEKGAVEPAGTGNATLEFKSCKATKPANCEVSEPITTEVSTALTGGPPVEDLFSPKNGTKFTTITLTGTSCALKGEPFEVTGTQKCKLPGGETEAVAHELECTTAGSSLKAGGATATFEGSIKGLELETGAAWSAV